MGVCQLQGGLGLGQRDYYFNADAPTVTIRNEYVKRLPGYQFVHLTKDTNEVYYFLISRPVAGRIDLRRGVVGRFILKKGSLMPDNFEEVVNTPHFSEDLVKERGGFLFRELVKKGKLDEYLSMKHYVEWPDKYLKYDKIIFLWFFHHQE